MCMLIKKKIIECLEKGNGFYLLKTEFGDKITDEIGRKVIEYINNDFEFNEIKNKLIKINDTTPEQASRYLDDFLIELDKLQCVVYKSEYESPNKSICVVGENEYSYVSQNIIDNLSDEVYTRFSFETDKHYFNKLLLRSRSFYNQENYFFDYFDKTKSRYNNLYGIRYLSSNDKVPVISLVQYDIFNIDFFESLMRYVASFNKNKVRIINTRLSLLGKNYETMLKNMGFNYEATLPKEDGLLDYTYYYKFIKGEI